MSTVVSLEEVNLSAVNEGRADLHRTFWEEGLLHKVNEEVLWDLGLCLTLAIPKDEQGERDWSQAHFYIEDHGEVLTTGLDNIKHATVHSKLDDFIRKRQESIKP
jgi:hypothetical protein